MGKFSADLEPHVAWGWASWVTSPNSGRLSRGPLYPTSAQLLLSTCFSCTPPPPQRGDLWQQRNRLCSCTPQCNSSLLSIPIAIKPPFHVLGNTKGAGDWAEIFGIGTVFKPKVYDFSHFPLCFLHWCLWLWWPVTAGTVAVGLYFPDGVISLM